MSPLFIYSQVQLLRDKLYALNGKHMPSVLVANKCDLKDHRYDRKRLSMIFFRQVTTEEGKRLAKSFDIPFFEISAKKHSSEVISNCFKKKNADQLYRKSI